MGCGDACPLYPFKKYEDWAIEIRDAIRARVERLLDARGVLTAR